MASQGDHLSFFSPCMMFHESSVGNSGCCAVGGGGVYGAAATCGADPAWRYCYVEVRQEEETDAEAVLLLQLQVGLVCTGDALHSYNMTRKVAASVRRRAGGSLRARRRGLRSCVGRRCARERRARTLAPAPRRSARGRGAPRRPAGGPSRSTVHSSARATRHKEARPRRYFPMPG